MTFGEVVCPQRFRQMANDVMNVTAFILPTQTQRQVADNAHQQRFPAVIGVKVFRQWAWNGTKAALWLGAKDKKPLGSKRAVVK